MSAPFLALLDLEQRILAAARPVEVAFLALNMAHGLVPYRQAALWTAQDGVEALSGLASVEENSPFVQWLSLLCRSIAAVDMSRNITAADVIPALAEQWGDWLPQHLLVLPAPSGHPGELLLYARDEVFRDEEVAVLAHLARLAWVTRRALTPKRFKISMPKGRRAWVVAGGLLMLGLFPVKSSVLAPADLVAAHPVVVRAPLDGVIDKIVVQPNEKVVEGQILLQLDQTTLAGRLDVARQQLATAEAEHRMAAQAMVFDPKAKSQLAILAGRVEEKAAEVRLLQNQLDRSTVTAPRSGIAVFDDPSEWIGKPISVGEKVMAVADETDSEVEAWVSVADLGEIKDGDALTLFLNTSPLSPVRAKVRSIAYEATARPDASLAHRVRATLTPDPDVQPKPRLGLKGTARIDGDRIALAWWLFRKPLTVVRQFLGA